MSLRYGIYADYLDVIKKTSKGEALLRIKGRLAMDVREPFHSDGRELEDTVRESLGNPGILLEELADAWGGCLEVDDVIAYQEGKRMADIFMEKRYQGEDVYFYEFKVYMYLQLKVTKNYIKGNESLKGKGFDEIVQHLVENKQVLDDREPE